MARVLILLELLLALPLFGIGKDLRRHLTGDQAESQCNGYRDNTPAMQHISSSIIVVYVGETFLPCRRLP